MASITIAEARNMLALYIDAEKKVLLGQEYTIKDRTLKRADLRYIAEERKKWQTLVDQLESGAGMKVKRGLPRDI